MIVAIDGPSGSGKSALAQGVAAELGWRHVESGVLYRAVATAALTGHDVHKAAAAVQLRDGKVLIGGVDVTSRLRDAAVTSSVPAVAADPVVRLLLSSVVRAEAGRTHSVVEGRDIGTVVLPDAAIKVFLTAPLEVRARIRASRLGINVASAAAGLAARDAADKARAHSPLVAAPDALRLDSGATEMQDLVRIVVGRVIEHGEP
jgi:cytidylate kinase